MNTNRSSSSHSSIKNQRNTNTCTTRQQPPRLQKITRQSCSSSSSNNNYQRVRVTRQNTKYRNSQVQGNNEMDVIRPHQSVQGRMNLKGNYGADIKIEVSKNF